MPRHPCAVPGAERPCPIGGRTLPTRGENGAAPSRMESDARPSRRPCTRRLNNARGKASAQNRTEARRQECLSCANPGNALRRRPRLQRLAEARSPFPTCVPPAAKEMMQPSLRFAPRGKPPPHPALPTLPHALADRPSLRLRRPAFLRPLLRAAISRVPVIGQFAHPRSEAPPAMLPCASLPGGPSCAATLPRALNF